MSKKFDLEKLTLPLMGLILVIAAAIFFFSKGDAGITGGQALSLQNGSFWLWAVVFILVACVAAYHLYKANKSDKAPAGKKTVLLLVIIICLAAPWGKACTSKSDPVTSPNYVPEQTKAP